MDPARSQGTGIRIAWACRPPGTTAGWRSSSTPLKLSSTPRWWSGACVVAGSTNAGAGSRRPPHPTTPPMSDRYDEPGVSRAVRAAAGVAGPITSYRGHPQPSGWLRGVGVVVVAVVIGVLLMPSATRAPLRRDHGVAVHPDTDASTTATRASSTTTTLATIVPGASSIHVLVANGTSITALAGGTSTYLRSRASSPCRPPMPPRR